MNFPPKLRNGHIYLMITGRNQWVHHRICIARTIREVDFVRVGRRAQDWMCVCVFFWLNIVALVLVAETHDVRWQFLFGRAGILVAAY